MSFGLQLDLRNAEARAKEWEDAYMQAMKRGDDWKSRAEKAEAEKAQLQAQLKEELASQQEIEQLLGASRRGPIGSGIIPAIQKLQARVEELGISARDSQRLLDDSNHLVADLEAKLKQAGEALKRIATEHQAYDDPGVPDGNYGIGVVDGHRCAAKIARTAIEAVNKEGK